MPHDAVSYVNVFAGDVVGCVFDVVDDAAAPDAADAIDAEVDVDGDLTAFIDAAAYATAVDSELLMLMVMQM